jgi:hypothetical protein
MLNQFPRNSRHVSRLPCEDASIFLEEFDEREFLFGIQTIAYVSDRARLLHGGLGLGHDRVWERLIQGVLQVLELCGCYEPIGRLIFLSLSQSKARFTSPLMEMTPHGPGIFRTK